MPDDRSLRDELEAAFDADKGADTGTDKVEGTDAAARGAAASGEPDDKADEKADKSADTPKADKASDKAPPADSKADKKADAKGDAKPDDKAAPKYNYREPPSRWSKEDKEAWAKAFGELDLNNPTHKQIGALRDMMFAKHEEAERTLNERETELTNKVKEFDGLVRVIAPYVPHFKNAGETPEQAIGNLLQLNTFATQRPEEFVHWFIKQRNLDPAKLFGGAAPAQPSSAVDDDDPLGLIPDKYKQAVALVPQLQQTIQQLQQQVGGFSQQWQGFQQQQTQAQRTQAQTYIQTWASEKDEHGNAKRPHYANQAVRDEMIRLLDGGIESDLDRAYDRATWAIPEVRQQIMESQAAREVASREARAREEAARKRAASSSIGSAAPSVSAGPSSADTANMDLRSLLSRALDEHSRGV